MSSSDVTTAWMESAPRRAKLYAKREGESAQSWADEAVDVVLFGGISTDPATGSGDPLTQVVVWALGDDEYSSTIRTWQGQATLDELVSAFKDAVVSAGGTIVEG